MLVTASSTTLYLRVPLTGGNYTLLLLTQCPSSTGVATVVVPAAAAPQDDVRTSLQIPCTGNWTWSLGVANCQCRPMAAARLDSFVASPPHLF